MNTMNKTLVDAAFAAAEAVLTTEEFNELFEIVSEKDEDGELDGTAAEVAAFIKAQADHMVSWRGAE